MTKPQCPMTKTGRLTDGFYWSLGIGHCDL